MQQLYSTRLNGLDLYFIKMDGFSIETVSTLQNCHIALNSGREGAKYLNAAIKYHGSSANADPLSHHKAKFGQKER